MADTSLVTKEHLRITAERVDQKIDSIPTPDVSGQINAHNSSTSAHQDIRDAIPKNAADVGAPTVAQAQGYANTAESNAKSYADQKIAAIPAPDASSQINAHNSSTSAHQDIRDAIPTTAEDVGALPIAGGTLTGKNLYFNNGGARVLGDANRLQLETNNVAGDTSNRRILHLRNSTHSESGIEDALALYDVANGEQTIYKIYGEHNPPTPVDIGATSVTIREW